MATPKKPGAKIGRPIGLPKTGGRVKGTPNQKNNYKTVRDAVIKDCVPTTKEEAAAKRRAERRNRREQRKELRSAAPAYSSDEEAKNDWRKDLDTSSPLAFMISVMNSNKMPVGFRYQAAKDAAKYKHPTLQSVTVKGDPTAPLASRNLTPAEFASIARKVAEDV